MKRAGTRNIFFFHLALRCELILIPTLVFFIILSFDPIAPLQLILLCMLLFFLLRISR